MGHLTPETLARLIDGAADAAEAAHLRACDACRHELAAFREQTDTLGELPDPPLPAGSWARLEERLETEGLLSGADAATRRRAFGAPDWMRLAASIVLFLIGGLTGFALRGVADPADGGESLDVRAATTAGEAEVAGAGGSPEDAVRTLEVAEANYRAALARFSELTDRPASTVDPVARLAALEGIVLTTREALRQAPADPLINGYHLAAAAERDAMIRRLALEDDDPWF
ncbi:MAG: hypothetical protein ACODAE_03715 [Gemmatimonadota bacterium]